MFICPTCEKEFKTEEGIKSHFLQCWKEKHPYHKSKSAPQSEDIVTKEEDKDTINFLQSLGVK